MPGDLYHVAQCQINQTASFHWQTSDRQCLITPFAGYGTAVLPFAQEQDGDTDTFTAPARGVVVQVEDHKGGNCTLRLFDATNGQELDVVIWSRGTSSVVSGDRLSQNALRRRSVELPVLVGLVVLLLFPLHSFILCSAQEVHGHR